MTKIKAIFIYSDHPSKSLSISEIVDYLRDYGLCVHDRGNLIESLNLCKEDSFQLAMKIAGSKVQEILTPLDAIPEPDYREANTELQRLTGKNSDRGVLYDGQWLQRMLYKIIAEKFIDEFHGGFIHMVFTSRLFGTFETKRYHARVILAGLPSLISTSGVVEAPARPKEYYWLKAGFLRGGKDIRELDIVYRGKFIVYDDERITQVLKSYALQAVFYELAGKAFCDNPDCCLFNSHWQDDVLRAQLKAKLCLEHRNILDARKN
ncbi:MAG: DUF6775 family putative metallopeptidase [Thermodesulfobacteriota bacterium]